ncbi:dihydrofolate reductase [Clostridium sp. D2Q-11]|uniref:Dihydrofolate reductase n=1 Tax=Anaeromonas frigoriresistens TaxID=2683708 RepID=A0A942UUQ2_9FIRM|nr:dihydrofolate reductase [Anaeromonas frigoriresistens]MBS4537139.1 dihydrofolate reductase [Anaeromonas frigoriresistens]
MNISMIVALDKNNGIGNENKLLAHIPEDLKYFKNVTNGQIIVMGYNTYLSLPKRPLPNRINIVLTRKNINLDGAIVVNSIDRLLDHLKEYKDKEIFICGGASIYEQMMPYSNKLYITHIFNEFSADTFFPKIEEEEWNIDSISGDFENIYNKYPHVFTIYKRK